MRIAFVAPFGLRAKGTTRARVLPLARELARRGHTVAVFVPALRLSGGFRPALGQMNQLM